MFNFERKISKMEALKFATLVGENGVHKIPGLKNYVNQNVEVIVVLNPEKKQRHISHDFSQFFEKWTGYFREISTEDLKYNYLMDKHR
jgi:hypothetical protein